MHLTRIPILLAILAFSFTAQADDFADMLREVDTKHPAIKAEQANLEATREGISQAYAGFLPNVGAQYDRGRQRIQFNRLPRESQETTTKQLTVTQPIFNGGGTLAQISTARARTQAGTARLSQVEQQVLLNAIAAYIDMAEKQEALFLTWENVDVLTRHLQGTQKQFKAGVITLTDVSQSEARLARANAQLRDAENALEDARANYIREIGREPKIEHFPPLPAALPLNEEDVTAHVATHPSLVEAQHNERAADYTINERFSTLLPSVSVQGQMSDEKGSTTPSINTVNDRAILLRVSVPIFQSGAEYSRLREARYDYTRAQNQTEDVARQTLRDAMREWDGYTASGKAIHDHEQASDAAQRALDGMRKEQLAGSRTVIDVLNAQDELYIARIDLLRAKARHVLSAYRLLTATGELDKVLPPPQDEPKG